MQSYTIQELGLAILQDASLGMYDLALQSEEREGFLAYLTVKQDGLTACEVAKTPQNRAAKELWLYRNLAKNL